MKRVIRTACLLQIFIFAASCDKRGISINRHMSGSDDCAEVNVNLGMIKESHINELKRMLTENMNQHFDSKTPICIDFKYAPITAAKKDHIRITPSSLRFRVSQVEDGVIVTCQIGSEKPTVLATAKGRDPDVLAEAIWRRAVLVQCSMRKELLVEH